MIEKQLLTARAVADRLGVSPPTVHQMMRRGELEWVRVGNRHKVPAAALDEYLANNTRPCAAMKEGK